MECGGHAAASYRGITVVICCVRLFVTATNAHSRFAESCARTEMRNAVAFVVEIEIDVDLAAGRSVEVVNAKHDPAVGVARNVVERDRFAGDRLTLGHDRDLGAPAFRLPREIAHAQRERDRRRSVDVQKRSAGSVELRTKRRHPLAPVRIGQRTRVRCGRDLMNAGREERWIPSDELRHPSRSARARSLPFREDRNEHPLVSAAAVRERALQRRSVERRTEERLPLKRRLRAKRERHVVRPARIRRRLHADLRAVRRDVDDFRELPRDRDDRLARADRADQLCRPREILPPQRDDRPRFDRALRRRDLLDDGEGVGTCSSGAQKQGERGELFHPHIIAPHGPTR